jgi:uncharacterized SAM-dependent methyltransferase
MTWYPFFNQPTYGYLKRSSSIIVSSFGSRVLNARSAIHKTKSILSGFRKQQKPVYYFALDVSRDSLEDSLFELRRSFEDCHFIMITGLLGTYDDCVTWLSGLESPRKDQSLTFLWLGNSISNMDSQKEASGFLERFSTACRHAQLGCRFVVSTDICQKDAKVLEAYDIEGSELRDFLSNALESANLALGYEAFSAADWTPSVWLDNYERTLHCYMMANRDVLIPLQSSAYSRETVAIRKGERLHVIASGKWSEDAMGSICEQAGFRIQKRWKDNAGDYCKRSFSTLPTCDVLANHGLT